MINGWKSVIESRVESLKIYRSENQWLLLERTRSRPLSVSRPPSPAQEHPGESESWAPVQFPIELSEEAEFWFRLDYTVPDVIHEISVSGSRALLHSRTLKPMEVILDGSTIFSASYWSDLCVPEAVVTEEADPGRVYKILIRIENTGSNGINDRFAITLEYEKVEELIFDLETFPQEMAFCDCLTRLVASEKREIYEAAIHAADARISGKEDFSIEDLRGEIGRIREILVPLEDAAKALTVHLIGHAHIDMNWLWTMEDTVDVCRRDFSTMARFMEEYPEFCFSQSQAAVYDIAETQFPELFEKIRQYVSHRRWDVTAATWTEGDLNMASGEATVRQILLARLHCEKRLGTSSRVCWEPDTFGHPATIPQILKKSGITYYYHMRCGRSGPLYIWEGPDGSEIVVFNSVYNNTVNATDIVKISMQLLESCSLKHAMFVYGVGDHGGGATRRDIQRALFLNSLPTMPRIVFSTAHRFFDALDRDKMHRLPRITGELNPIFDGCYTSHANLKYLMRACENRLMELEVADALAQLYTSERHQSQSAIVLLWRTVLFNQFHDIFCGCAIHATYEQAEPQLRSVVEESKQLTSERLSLILGELISRDGMDFVDATPGSQFFAVWNLQGHMRTDIVAINRPNTPADWSVRDEGGAEVPKQLFESRIYFIAEDVPPFGYRLYSLHPASGSNSTAAQSASQKDGASGAIPDQKLRLESEFYRMTIDAESGCITELQEIENAKALIAVRDWIDHIPDYNNLFSIEYETPHRLSAWTIGPISRIENLIRGARVSVESRGPVMHVISVQHRLGRSRINQRIYFYKRLRRIDFKTTVDWNEVSGPDRDGPLLRVTFKPNLSRVAKAKYDIPFGIIERNADGTEYPGQKWVDIGDDQSGFSLINNGRYGFRCVGSALSMTCVRTSYAPDPEPDRGKSTFDYALFPHTGDPIAAGTPQEAVGFNSPLIPISIQKQAVRNGSARQLQPASLEPGAFSLIRVEAEGVMVSSVKRHKDGTGVVMRIYELQGTEKVLNIETALALERVEEISPTEDRVIAEVRISKKSNGFADHIGKYEIKTYRLTGRLSRAFAAGIKQQE